jgi:hypothetical protein
MLCPLLLLFLLTVLISVAARSFCAPRRPLRGLAVAL